MSTDLPPNAPGDPRPKDSTISDLSTDGDGQGLSSANPLLSRILVVDDSAENVRLLLRILQRGGYTEVTGITDPRSVLDGAKETAPDLVILDLHMPHMDGYAVMHELRTALTHVPKFLLVTGEVEEEVRSLALARGADDLVTKPFQVEDMLRRVGMLLAPSVRRAAGGRPEG